MASWWKPYQGTQCHVWLSRTGRLFENLSTLEVHARHQKDTEWAGIFQRMPHLTHLTAHGLILTTCEPFAQLPRLEKLQGVLWPLDCRLHTIQCGTPVSRARYFASLCGLGVASLERESHCVPGFAHLDPTDERNGLFPTVELVAFMDALPRDLQWLEVFPLNAVSATAAPPLTLRTLRPYVAYQVAMEQQAAAAYLQDRLGM